MSSGQALRCWRCGVAIDDALLPLRREEVCVACNADLHVCKLCTFYNPSVSDACDEPIAADVTNKERANFCDYLKPSAQAYRGAGSAADDASRAALAALFGESKDDPSMGDDNGARSALDRLFGLDDDQ